LEDIAVDTFFVASRGTFVMALFQALFTTPSRQSFSVLACGWILATERHTITTYLWCTGGTTLKYFSRFYAFLGGPLAAMGSDHLPGCWVQPNEPIVLELEVHDRLPER
jgi:hypothetical protein